jgi:hypothetical protein
MEGIVNLDDLDVNGRIILKYILRNRLCGLNSSGSGQGPVAGSCEHGNEPSGFVKARNLLIS